MSKARLGRRRATSWSASTSWRRWPAFDRTQHQLAEKLFAALKAGDDAGGDSRGRQSASILVVRNGGGRNTNNDRYVFVNVDDHQDPIDELRRLIESADDHQPQRRPEPRPDCGTTSSRADIGGEDRGYQPLDPGTQCEASSRPTWPTVDDRGRPGRPREAADAAGSVHDALRLELERTRLRKVIEDQR